VTAHDVEVLPADARDELFDLAFARITGSWPVDGNGIRLLKDAGENYPAWLDAIARAERTVHFENYIVADDEVGRDFARALAERARAGVRVRLLYDWWGSFRIVPSDFWARLREAGVEVRAFNPPQPTSPLAWVKRNHRKAIAVDGRIGFVSGLCVSRAWVGDPAKGIAAWRDTGVELRGPVVADIEDAFAETWIEAGGRIPPEDMAGSIAGGMARPAGPVPGGVRVRVIRGRPGRLGVYRLDQLIASAARRTLWLTDAYFVASTTFVRALADAVRDGVDVRILVPGTSDAPAVQALVRASYRPLIEAGIRVFEWNGSMLHAKTAVSDGKWSRIGSTNLNVASWLTNWELDVTVEDRGFAEAMEATYLDDLRNATEIVLDDRRRVHPAAPPPRRDDHPDGLPHRRRLPRRGPERTGSGRRLAAGALGVGNTAGAAITGSRPLSPMEGRVLFAIGFAMLVLAVLVAAFPLVVVVPLVTALVWFAGSLLLRAWRLWKRRA
jgi:cardiolipin synthase